MGKQLAMGGSGRGDELPIQQVDANDIPAIVMQINGRDKSMIIEQIETERIIGTKLAQEGRERIPRD